MNRLKYAALSATMVAFGTLVAGSTEMNAVGEWEVEVRVNVDGHWGVAKLEVVPQSAFEVSSERYDGLEEWKPDQPGWARPKIRGLTDGMCGARFALDSETLVVTATPGLAGPRYQAGRDYAVDGEWGCIGRLPGGALDGAAGVWLSYRYHRKRLDSVVLTNAGELVLRRGEPHISMPLPPALAEGDRRVGNIFITPRLKALGPDNLFPILEERFPGTVHDPQIELLLPKTLAKLRWGEPLTILAWGDSVTEGYLGEQQWQKQVVRRLEERFPDAKIDLVTVGWGAHTSQSFLDAAPGHPRNYAQAVLSRAPDLVISLFVNDGNLPDVALTEANYARFRRDFAELGAEWIIVTPHYIAEWMGLSRERDIDEDPRPYVSMLRHFAREHHVALADASRRYGRLWRQGIPFSTLMVNAVNHPDARGMSIFADAVMELMPEQ